MDKREEEFIKRINETFRIEAEEHLNAISSSLNDLEKTQSQERYAEIVETMFRDIHSLKGAARSVEQKEIESLCQPMESVFSALKRNELALSPTSFDLFYKAVKSLSRLITETGTIQTVTERQSQRELTAGLRELAVGILSSNSTTVTMQIKEIQPVKSGQENVSEVVPENEIRRNIRPLSSDSVRIRISKLDPLLLQAEEMIQSKRAIGLRIDELHEINSCFAGIKIKSQKRNAVTQAGPTSSWNDGTIINEAGLSELEIRLKDLTASMERDQYLINNMLDIHLEAMRKVLMLPVSIITEVFPGMVREIAREQKKEIEFVIKGSELEIDKRILEELKDPLSHMIRNSIDHGIDRPEERTSQNRPAKGTIILSFAATESGMIEIILSDDGCGINKEDVLIAAIKSGVISEEAAMKLGSEEILSLIYQSGVSTSSSISNISGRGIGLSIVREKVEKLNGRISFETDAHKGTSFHILLPMTLASFRGILVRVSELMFILPALNVEKVIWLKHEAIKTIENRDTILFGDKIISLVNLGEALGLPEHKHAGLEGIETATEKSDQVTIAVIISGEQRIALRIDEIIDEQQVLVKSLGSLLKRVRNISGATILGSGRVVPILHINDLFHSALSSAKKTKEHTSIIKRDDRIKKILVADDSITSRILLKNILETAGYNVTTAIDGADALNLAYSNNFDLIVSDVDMPRMNGFELTTKIRHDKKLTEVPVVLVTSLGSTEDHERGVEAGADAYIIKSSFDETSLLEIIKKLI
jgi:two-component system, chemotaxis family, sensor kinase CheA